MKSGHRWNIAGDDCLDLLIQEYRVGDRVHWPTVIAAASCLSGEMALMAHETRLPERGTVDSPRVAAFLHDGTVRTRTLWGYTAAIASQAYDINEDALPTYRNVLLHLGTHLGTGSYPALDVPLHMVPHETPMNAGPRLRRQMHELARVDGVVGADMAFALMTAAMKMIGSTRDLNIRDLIAMALQCCAAGARFVPLVEPDKAHGSYTTMPEAAEKAPSVHEAEPSVMPASAMLAAMLSDTPMRPDS